MKKKVLYTVLLFSALLVTACGGKTKTVESSHSSKQTEKTSQTSKTTEKSQSKSSETSASTSTTKETAASSTSQEQTTVSSKQDTPEEQAKAVLGELNNHFPNNQLPQAILTSQTNHYLTAATTPTADQGSFRILYYAENQPITVNDPAVNNLQPIASFEKKTYASDLEALDAVGQIIDNNGMKIDLGHGITGYQQGAAGSSYLSWQEGNWSLVVQASNIEGEKAEPLAKQVVNYLETAMLPAPQNAGQISLRVSTKGNYEENYVVWQKGAIVYTIQHFDALQAVKMAVSAN